MLKNYLKFATRNLLKKKGITLINICGLSIGIACFILLLLFTFNEYSFDKFHKNAANIYRAYLWLDSWNGQPAIGYTDYEGPNQATLAEAMKNNLPDVINTVQLQLPWGENLVRSNKNIIRTSVSWANPSFFSVFTFPLKYGMKGNVLKSINDVVLTESIAKNLFGNDKVVGKMVEIKIGKTFRLFNISAVAKDIPSNSTIRFNILGNFLYAKNNNDQFIIGKNWHPTVRQTYVQLKPGSKLPSNKDRLNGFIKSFNPNFGITQNGNKLPISFRLQPLLSIHTDNAFVGWGFVDYKKINPETIWILFAISIGILLIASLNFTTISVSRSVERSKETGIRKVFGAKKRQIIFLFLIESILICFFSALIGLQLLDLILPWFNQISGRELLFSSLISLQMFSLIVGLVLMVGLLAGIYPALVLTNLKQIESLKSEIRVGSSKLYTKSLVTLQFALSIILIISAFTILNQTNYMISKNPGFNKENVVSIDASDIDPNTVFPLFRQVLLNYPEIKGVASAAAGIGAGQKFLGYSDQGLSANLNVIDTNYINVLGMQLIAGTNFNQFHNNDTTKSIIINETMMKSLGLTPPTAIGKKIKNFQHQSAIIIGVVKNFNYRPLSEEIKNQAFITSKDKGYVHFYVRIKTGDPIQALLVIKKVWKRLSPNVPIKYSFLDEDINNYYNSEQRWISIVSLASSISIFLACLGLIGLTSIAAANRTKEIGVRKVLGASINSIVSLFAKDFIKWILMANIIAWPVAYYFMNKWLQGFAYRIELNLWMFTLAGGIALLIALVTVCFQAIKAATVNPVKSLRYE